jgi:nucleoporin NUP82
MDPEEPQQTLSFMPERSRASSIRGDSSARDVVSFCLGNGKADWGPLTVYALTKSGDIWAMCPFMPSNACVLVLCRHVHTF